MRRGSGAGLGLGRWLGWGLGLVPVLVACGPTVPADTSAHDPPATGTDDGLPPLTSGTVLPPALDSGGGASEGPYDDPPRYDLDGAATTGPPVDPCAAGWDLTPLSPAVVLVIETSGSMITHLVDHDGDPQTPLTTRWFALWTALADSLEDWDLSYDLGLRTYPSALATTPPDPFACDPDGVALVPAAMGALPVLDALPLPRDPTLDGAAPLRPAIHEAQALLSAVFEGKRRLVVLITDGAPNCAPELPPPDTFDQADAQVEDVIYLGALAGIPTAVIALDVPDAVQPAGSGEPFGNPREQLDALAAAGGFSAAALVASDGPGLRARLEQVRVALPSGDRLQIPDASYPWYWLEIDGVRYELRASCDDGDGFVMLDGDVPWDTMQMCGSAVTALQRAGHAHVWPECVIAE